jgi:hypothetical protein
MAPRCSLFPFSFVVVVVVVVVISTVHLKLFSVYITITNDWIKNTPSQAYICTLYFSFWMIFIRIYTCVCMCVLYMHVLSQVTEGPI